MDTSGKRFDRQSAARKSLLHVQSGLHAIEDANDSSHTDSVKRRSRSRKPRGNRRNTIAGTDQKEIEGITENGFVYYGHVIDFVEHGVRLTITLKFEQKPHPPTESEVIKGKSPRRIFMHSVWFFVRLIACKLSFISLMRF